MSWSSCRRCSRATARGLHCEQKGARTAQEGWGLHLSPQASRKAPRPGPRPEPARAPQTLSPEQLAQNRKGNSLRSPLVTTKAGENVATFGAGLPQMDSSRI